MSLIGKKLVETYLDLKTNQVMSKNNIPSLGSRVSHNTPEQIQNKLRFRTSSGFLNPPLGLVQYSDRISKKKIVVERSLIAESQIDGSNATVIEVEQTSTIMEFPVDDIVNIQVGTWIPVRFSKLT